MFKKTVKSTVAIILLTCSLVILCSCGTGSTKNSSETGSSLQMTDDGGAVFDGKKYAKVTEIK